ncbi:MAG: class I SAM-dependent methyltransferase, partial [Candidatus Binatia bacterium]
MHTNSDSWIPPAEVGSRFPPYQPTYEFDGNWVNDEQRTLGESPGPETGSPIEVGSLGTLRREEALKLYEMAYFAEGDILELGTERGFSTAILARAVRAARATLGGRPITSVDRDPESAASGGRHLEREGLSRLVTFEVGDA